MELAAELERTRRTKAVGLLANYPGLADRNILPKHWIELISPVTRERLCSFEEAVKGRKE